MIFLAEIGLLQHLEKEETDLVKPKGLVFQTKACNLCGHTHSILSEQEEEFCVFIAGVDEPFDRNTGEGGVKHSKEAKEYRWQRLNAEEQTFFREAMDKEWNSFLELEAVKIIRDKDAKTVPKARIMGTRFVLTNKDSTGDTLICKARLVAGGHQGPDIQLLRTDAPTADNIAINLILTFAASLKWMIQSGDNSTAFLSGVEDVRNLYLRPPKEGLPGVNPGDLLELRKGVYGLANAPRLWWRRLRQVLCDLGFTESRLLPCVFVYWARDASGTPVSLMGITAIHVDAMLISGSPEFETVIARLKQSLTFGKWCKSGHIA